ncbi:hypothetical protein EG329_002233 [Mollisiaceae sp. DMI_Dod_QoI]|nr:hypothetical protein EG329_002233 [Helotiales sp. DMI_Dod_QoI]
MLGTTPQCEFSPLGTDDVEHSIADAQDIIDNDEIAQRPWEGRGYFWRACIWTICSATALITTKRLMFAHGCHYPLTIAFHSFTAILVTYILRAVFGSTNTQANTQQWSFRNPSESDLLPTKYWAFMLPAAMTAAASFPMLLEGMLHMQSLPVIVMLFPLVYAAESVVLFISCSSRSQKSLPWEAMLIALPSAFVLQNEYRLTVPGLIWGVTSVLLLGLSRACFVIGTERIGLELAVEARREANNGFLLMTVLFGLLFSGIAAYPFEHIHYMHPLDDSTKGLMVVNIAAIVGTAFSGTSTMTFTPISFEDTHVQFSNIPVPPIEILASLTSSLLVGLISVYLQPTYVSWIQITEYLAASAALAGGTRIYNFTVQCMGFTQQQFKNSLRKDFPESRMPSSFTASAVAFTFIVLLSWSLSALSSASIDSLPPSLPTTFDLSYRSHSQFDIVISMYQESPSSVKSMIEKLKSTAYLSIIAPDVQVIIYTKDSSSDLDLLKNETGADIVQRFPNTGREGGTYLQHIVSNWNFLAEKTMFIQAHAHNMRELIPRINSYLVPQTGMLSLGFTGVTCECGACSDRWGWEDKWSVVPTLYEEIYGAPCESSQQITLSYKGQFVASAKRIRGIDKKIYQDLLDAITSRDGWPHNATTLGLDGNGEAGGGEGDADEEDSPNNPLFGFAVERIWGLLMQCGTDARVAARCPSLLSGTSRGRGIDGRVEDCQCLDEIG